MRTHEYCDKCGTELEAEFVDIGIGWEQVTEAHCPNNCDYIEWLYEQYAKDVIEPLSLDDWLKLHEVPKEERE